MASASFSAVRCSLCRRSIGVGVGVGEAALAMTDDGNVEVEGM